MNVKLSDLYVGVIDFFSILLPGALLCFFAEPLAVSYVFGPVLPTVKGYFEAWIIFLFASYLAGHFVFLVASHLDELVYERIRKGEFWGKSSPNEKPLVRHRIRRLLLSEKADQIADEARSITESTFSPDQVQIIDESYLSETVVANEREVPQRERQLKGGPLNDSAKTQTVSLFKWAKVQIVLHHPTAITEVHRLEADSKFFRSLIVVFCFVAFTLALAKLGFVRSYEPSWLVLVSCIILIILALWRYANQRWKSTELAFLYLVAINKALGQATKSEPPNNRSN